MRETLNGHEVDPYSLTADDEYYLSLQRLAARHQTEANVIDFNERFLARQHPVAVRICRLIGLGHRARKEGQERRQEHIGQSQALAQLAGDLLQMAEAEVAVQVA